MSAGRKSSANRSTSNAPRSPILPSSSASIRCSAGDGVANSDTVSTIAGTSMQAAVMKDDQRPVYDRFAEPQAIGGAVVVEVLAAALTVLDKVVAQRPRAWGAPGPGGASGPRWRWRWGRGWRGCGPGIDANLLLLS